MLRLPTANGEENGGAEPGGTSDTRPVWSGDGGRRCVGDGRGISGRPGLAWSAALLASCEPPAVADVPVVPGARYFCGRRYWEAVIDFV